MIIILIIHSCSLIFLIGQDDVRITEFDSLRSIVKLNRRILTDPERKQLVSTLIPNLLLSNHLLEVSLLPDLVFQYLGYALVYPLNFIDCHFNVLWF